MGYQEDQMWPERVNQWLLKDMSIMNDALLTKHLHKLYNKEDVP
jgi:hypothetical protein